ncbi:unnamed protein product [Gordionus sp. m RMFG-2023]
MKNSEKVTIDKIEVIKMESGYKKTYEQYRHYIHENYPFLHIEAMPNFYTWMLSNKSYASLMIFFISNAIESQLLSTGAFEIKLNDVPLWSKIESGRVPAIQELFQILDNQMRLINLKRPNIH